MKSLLLLIVPVLLCGCALNYDPIETAPQEAFGVECDHDDDDHHDHAPGEICSDTWWFFTQPWAARWYWGKLLRDGIVLLALASLVTVVSRRRGK